MDAIKQEVDLLFQKAASLPIDHNKNECAVRKQHVIKTLNSHIRGCLQLQFAFEVPSAATTHAQGPSLRISSRASAVALVITTFHVPHWKRFCVHRHCLFALNSFFASLHSCRTFLNSFRASLRLAPHIPQFVPRLPQFVPRVPFGHEGARELG